DRTLDGIFFDRFENLLNIVDIGVLETVVHQTGSAIYHALCNPDPNGHFGELVLDRSERGDGLTECDPLPGVLNRIVESRFRPADRSGAQLRAADVQNVERNVMALADLPDNVLNWNLCVIQNERACGGSSQAHLVLFSAGRNAGIILLDDEAAE